MSEVDDNEELSRTPRGGPAPPERFQIAFILQSAGTKQLFFNEFEVVLEALGELPNVTKESPMAPQSGREMS